MGPAAIPTVSIAMIAAFMFSPTRSAAQRPGLWALGGGALFFLRPSAVTECSGECSRSGTPYYRLSARTSQS